MAEARARGDLEEAVPNERVVRLLDLLGRVSVGQG
jgi:hypothetical protein